jgi:hypothetical protein
LEEERYMSTPEQNKEIVRRFYAEVMTAGNVDVCDEIVHEDFHDHGETLFGSPQGRQALKDSIVGGHSVFPDLNVTLEDVVAADDYARITPAVSSSANSQRATSYSGMASRCSGSATAGSPNAGSTRIVSTSCSSLASCHHSSSDR